MLESFVLDKIFQISAGDDMVLKHYTWMKKERESRVQKFSLILNNIQIYENPVFFFTCFNDDVLQMC